MAKRLVELKALRKEAKQIRKDFAKVDNLPLSRLMADDAKFDLLKQYQAVASKYYDTKFCFQKAMPRITFKDPDE